MNPNVPSATTTAGYASNEKSFHSEVSGPKATTSSLGTKDQSCFSTACVVCRTRHLKCDRRYPCSRCEDSGSQCTYVASRRGYNRLRPAITNESNGADTLPLKPGSPGRSVNGDSSKKTENGLTDELPADSLLTSLSWDNQSLDSSSDPLFLCLDQIPGGPSENDSPSTLYPATIQTSLADRCLSSFYRNFHPAHPFVLPEQFLLELTPEVALCPLLAAMRWVGSLYLNVPAGAKNDLFGDARRKLGSASTPRDGFLVQAMMILLIGLDGLCHFDEAKSILRDTEQLAVQISLHTRPFATLQGRGMPVLEECWRRTWWELYVIDGMIAGLHRATNFELYDIQTDVALPCEEWEYHTACISKPRTLDDLDNYNFTDAEDNLSSFAYLIQSARNLGQLLRLPASLGPDDPELSNFEAFLTNWRLHLPHPKRDAVALDGSSDEVMFQAHMLHHATSILLHYPHSQIDSLSAQKVNSCTSNPPLMATGGGPFFNAHTRHAVAAAGEISGLITHRAPLRSHTPFFTCVVVLASVVHLNQWASFFSSGFSKDDEMNLREKVRLGTGGLSEMSAVWQTAAIALGQVRGVAREIYQTKQRQQGNGSAEETSGEDGWGELIEGSMALDVAMTCPLMDP